MRSEMVFIAPVHWRQSICRWLSGTELSIRIGGDVPGMVHSGGTASSVLEISRLRTDIEVKIEAAYPLRTEDFEGVERSEA